MPIDFRLDPFQDVLNPVTITGETHVIPNVSPYTIRLGEVPLKETPSSISLTIGGVVAEEVSSAPAAGQFWPDYSTGADNDENWNTGTILFNAADAGKTVVVTYKGTGCIVWADFVKPHIFTESGTITAPSWATHAIISGCGGGGGAQSGAYSATYAGGAGGGGAASVIGLLVEVSSNTTYTIIIGAGGTTAASPQGSGGGSNNGIGYAGSNGGTTSFGDLLSLPGGKGGTSASVGGAAGGWGGEAGANGTTGTSGSAGGSCAFGIGGAARTTAGDGNAPTGYGAGGGGASPQRLSAKGAPGTLMIRWIHM